MAIVKDKDLGTNFAASGLSVALTTTNAVASGGFIIIGISEAGDTTALSSVSGGSLTWSIDKNAVVGDTGGFRTYFASAQAPSGLAANTVITATWPGGFGGVELIIGGTSFTGVKTSSPLDGSPTLNTTTAATTSWTAGPLTIQDGSILVGMSTSDNTSAGNSPTSPSLEAWERLDGPNLYGAALQYRIETTGGSFSTAGNWGTSGNVAVCAIAYLAAPAPPADSKIAWVVA